MQWCRSCGQDDAHHPECQARAVAGHLRSQDDPCHPKISRQSPEEGPPGRMGSSQADKAASHERIVTAASRRIRRDGIDNVSVSELMNEAGLTHGGFYRHFDTRDELVVE